MKIDIVKLKSNADYRATVRQKNARAFFVLGSAYLLTLIVFASIADITYVASWFAIVCITVAASAFLCHESPRSTAVGFWRLYRDGYVSFLRK